MGVRTSVRATLRSLPVSSNRIRCCCSELRRETTREAKRRPTRLHSAEEEETPVVEPEEVVWAREERTIIVGFIAIDFVVVVAANILVQVSERAAS